MIDRSITNIFTETEILCLTSRTETNGKTASLALFNMCDLSPKVGGARNGTWLKSLIQHILGGTSSRTCKLKLFIFSPHFHSPNHGRWGFTSPFKIKETNFTVAYCGVSYDDNYYTEWINRHLSLPHEPAWPYSRLPTEGQWFSSHSRGRACQTQEPTKKLEEIKHCSL